LNYPNHPTLIKGEVGEIHTIAFRSVLTVKATLKSVDIFLMEVTDKNKLAPFYGPLHGVVTAHRNAYALSVCPSNAANVSSSRNQPINAAW